jgi:hypothetical protein
MPTYKKIIPPSVTEAQRLIREHEQAITALRKYLDALKGIESLNSPNGHHESEREVPRVHNPPIKPGAPTGLKKAIRDLAPKLATPFTVGDLAEKLRGKVKFNGDAKNAIRDAVNNLHKKDKVLKLVETGTGGKPNKYQAA